MFGGEYNNNRFCRAVSSVRPRDIDLLTPAIFSNIPCGEERNASPWLVTMDGFASGRHKRQGNSWGKFNSCPPNRICSAVETPGSRKRTGGFSFGPLTMPLEGICWFESNRAIVPRSIVLKGLTVKETR